MPYASVADLPDNIKKLGAKQQRQWRVIWNSAYASCMKKGGSTKKCESSAFAQANGVVLSKAAEEGKMSEDQQPAGLYVSISKADPIKGVIYGIVNASNLIDHEGDFTTPEELQKAAWGFMAALQKGEIDGSPVNDTHKFGDIGGVVVESWLDDDANWRIAFRPDDIEIAKAAARGDYCGWSMEGLGTRVPVGA